jgi:hypothetical protein
MEIKEFLEIGNPINQKNYFQNMLQNISSKYNRKFLHNLYNEHDNNIEVLFYHYHVLQLKKKNHICSITPKHDFHDYIHTTTCSNKIHCLCHFDINNYKNDVNNRFDLAIFVFL